MNIDTELIILRELEIIKALLQKREGRKLWVKVGVIKEKTGWDRVRLRKAREWGEIEFKKNNKGYWYDLNSIPKTYIINK